MIDAIVQWLSTSLSGATNHQIDGWLAWHARTMTLAWGILIPLGVVIARFFKVTPKQHWPEQLDNKAWWHSHRFLQSMALLLMGIGFILAFEKGGRSSLAAALHGYVGWSICIVAVLQVIYALFRGSKGGPTDHSMRGHHYDMTAYRIRFENVHKIVGWLSVLLALPTIVIGLFLADAPRWMLLILSIWWIALAWFAAVQQRKGRCLDTYQAIWGPGLEHPGNQRPLAKPTGWGVSRHSKDSWNRTFQKNRS
jgi:hypothetical protein